MDGNNVGVAPTTQSRKEYHKSYYQCHKQKNIATDVSEEDNISQDYPYDFVYNRLPKEHCLLKEQPPCVICRAKKIQYEFLTFCCMNGKMSLQPLDIPPELYNLFTSQCQLGKMFRKNIRAYKTNFSFASMGVTLDKRYDLYFYDPESKFEHRLKWPNLDREIVTILSLVLAPNPYVQTFRSLGNLGLLDKYRVELTTSFKDDQRLYNRPTTFEVAGIWVESNENITTYKRSIVMYERSEYCWYMVVGSASYTLEIHEPIGGTRVKHLENVLLHDYI
ncbi:hypothetical protein Tco_0397858 [Tanacetum coccineum]